jgi:TolB protein
MMGNFIVTAQVIRGEEGINQQHEVGWMARTSLHNDSPYFCAGINNDGVASLQFRRKSGVAIERKRIDLCGVDVIQLERKGRVFILSAARFGEPFGAIEVNDIDLGDDIFIGLFVYSKDVIGKITFQNVRIVVPVIENFNREKDAFGSLLEILEIEIGKRQVVYYSDDVFEAPNWTVDGKALIFNSHGKLFRFDLETKISVLIDTGDVIRNNNDHVLSFDGRRLAISSHSSEDGHSMIYTVPVQGGNPKQITGMGPSYLHGWSPDGKFLVFTGLRNGDYDIYRIPAEGGDEVQLTTSPGLDDGPEYTPDGRFIYFNSVRSGRMQIWRMKPDGHAQEQMTDDEYNNWFPHISPDGKLFVFVTYLVNEVTPSDHPAAKRIYLRTMPLSGGTPKVVAYLYGGQGTMNVPSWSPDGKKVAFVSNTVPYE